MKIIGLTGGIASGKSTVHRMLSALGAQLVDADAVYHDLIAPRGGIPSSLARAIGRRFPGVLEPGGSIDRRLLARRVFGDAKEKEALEQLSHPAVAAEVARRVAKLGRGGVTQVIYDVPLLYERQLETGMAGVIVVWVPQEVQLARLIARDRLDTATALQRIAAQMSLDEKRRRATWVIDNSGSEEETRGQVERLWKTLAG